VLLDIIERFKLFVNFEWNGEVWVEIGIVLGGLQFGFAFELEEFRLGLGMVLGFRLG